MSVKISPGGEVVTAKDVFSFDLISVFGYSYVINVVHLMLLKVKGESLVDQPVVHRLTEIRTVSLLIDSSCMWCD